MRVMVTRVSHEQVSSTIARVADGIQTFDSPAVLAKSGGSGKSGYHYMNERPCVQDTISRSIPELVGSEARTPRRQRLAALQCCARQNPRGGSRLMERECRLDAGSVDHPCQWESPWDPLRTESARDSVACGPVFVSRDEGKGEQFETLREALGDVTMERYTSVLMTRGLTSCRIYQRVHSVGVLFSFTPLGFRCA
ncbi:hypothetical protein BJX63DRAFT_415050 [Aspergillus granulosus]|uniref:Uncharacterized protein n=1 Tax=Aspergillus granulosus TaxID=176169 RepID=A0ABR4GTS1_9EURO